MDVDAAKWLTVFGVDPLHEPVVPAVVGRLHDGRIAMENGDLELRHHRMNLRNLSFHMERVTAR